MLNLAQTRMAALSALCGWATVYSVYVAWWVATGPHEGDTAFVSLGLFYGFGTVLTWLLCLLLISRTTARLAPIRCLVVGGATSTAVFLVLHGAWTEAWGNWYYMLNAASIGGVAGLIYGKAATSGSHDARSLRPQPDGEEHDREEADGSDAQHQ